jgi:hypothetical protein
MRLFLYFVFPTFLLAQTNVLKNVVLPCALTDRQRLFDEIIFPFRLSVCTEGTLFYFVINGLKSVFYLNYNGTYSTKSVKCICPRIEKFVVPLDIKYLMIKRFGPNVRIEWANLAQAAQIQNGPKDASTTSTSTSFSTTMTSTAFSLNNYINTQTTDFVQSFVMGVIGIISALLTGLMVYFRGQVSAIITKINQPLSPAPTTVSTHTETVTTSDDSELTARLLALRQHASVTTVVQQHTVSSQENNAPPSPPSASSSTIIIPSSNTIVDEQAKKLPCSVRQLDMRIGCGQTCKNVTGLKNHERACSKNVVDQQKKNSKKNKNEITRQKSSNFLISNFQLL